MSGNRVMRGEEARAARRRNGRALAVMWALVVLLIALPVLAWRVAVEHQPADGTPARTQVVTCLVPQPSGPPVTALEAPPCPPGWRQAS